MPDPAPWRTILLAEVGSTNRVLLERFAPVARPGLVVVADHQREGRGRLARRFEDLGRSALAASVLVPPRLPIALWPAAIGVAAVEGLRALGVTRAALKWPNDLVCPEGKLGGVLIEARGERVVAGLGINLLAAPRGIGAAALCDIWPPAGTMEFGPLRHAVLDAYLSALAGVLEEGPEALLVRYRGLLVTLGQRVRVELPEGELIGWAEEVDACGRLRVVCAEGVATVAVGDVVHLRPIQHHG